MTRNPLRANAVWFQGDSIQLIHEVGEQGRNMNPDEIMNGWENNSQRDEKEPSEEFLNDEENENGNLIWIGGKWYINVETVWSLMSLKLLWKL